MIYRSTSEWVYTFFKHQTSSYPCGAFCILHIAPTVPHRFQYCAALTSSRYFHHLSHFQKSTGTLCTCMLRIKVIALQTTAVVVTRLQEPCSSTRSRRALTSEWTPPLHRHCLQRSCSSIE